MANPRRGGQPDAMNEAESTANDLAKLLAEEHARRVIAEDTASQLAIRLIQQQEELERERSARAHAEAQAQELSTLILGDAPAEPTRFIPQRRRLQAVS
jgi:hypothetical protein